MPCVNVVLKNGVVIPVEGANSAYWGYHTGGAASPAQAELLFVQLTVPNKVETLANFKAGEIAGFVIDQR